MRACRNLLMAVVAVGLSLGTVQAQEYRSAPARKPPVDRALTPRLQTYFNNTTPKLLEDFGEQYLYAPANTALGAPAAGEQRIVFLGDSITNRWNLTSYFPGKPYVNRGIDGQVTPQMLVRFHSDVVALKPVAVVILAGINDIGGVLQIVTEEQTLANYEAMAEIATAHGIKPIFSEILPRRIVQPTETDATDEDRRRRTNAWLKAYCAKQGYAFIEYGPVVSDEAGQFKPDYTTDGTHPVAAGYGAMTPVARKIIEAALAR